MAGRSIPVENLSTEQLFAQLGADVNVMRQYILGQVEFRRLSYVVDEAQLVLHELRHRGIQLVIEL